MSTGALEGLRVIEMGQLIAGPFCGQLLGDMGADVIKIETPVTGDPMRSWGRGEMPLWWEVIARNKRSVTIDLRKPDGQALVRRLIGEADVLIENFRPGTLEKWGLDPAGLLAEQPQLIICRMSGYGQTGPYAQRAGFGLIGEAMGGLRHVVGDPDRPSSRVGISIGDTLCATYGCIGVLSALEHRHRTGRGQVIDSSLYESVLQVMESLVVDYSVSGHVRKRTGAILPGIAPSNVYRCLDGDVLIGANNDGVFVRLCAAIGRPDLAQDPRFIDHEARGRHQHEIDEIIAAWTGACRMDEVESAMIAHAIPAGRSYRAPDMLADPHFQARGSIVEVQHPRHGSMHMQGVFPLLSETPGRIWRLAPAVPGQNNREILSELLAMNDDEIDALARAGVI